MNFSKAIFSQLVLATDPEEENMELCTRLEGAIARFFPETKMYKNALYDSMDYNWDFAKDEPEYDIYESHGDRKAFACRLLSKYTLKYSLYCSGTHIHQRKGTTEV